MQLGFTLQGKSKIYDVARAFMHTFVGKQQGSKQVNASAKRLQQTIAKLASKKATSTVPANAAMIKEKIVKAFRSHEAFDVKIRESLMAAIEGYTSHLELAATGKALGKSKGKPGYAAAVDEFCKMLERAATRTLPSDPLEFGFSVLDLEGRGRKGKGDILGRGVARLLRVNHSLTELNLAGNNLGPEGAKALGPAIPVSKSLTSINLSSNLGGPEFSKAIAEAISVSKSLTEVRRRQ